MSIHSLAHVAVQGPEGAAPWSRTGAKVCGGAAKLETALIFQSAHYTFQAYKPAGRAHVVTRGPACPAPFTRQPWLPRRSFKFQDLAAFEQRCHSAPPGQASTPFACRACAGLHLPTGGVGAHRMRHISPDHEVWRRFGTQARAACRGRGKPRCRTCTPASECTCFIGRSCCALTSHFKIARGSRVPGADGYDIVCAST